MHIVMIAPNQLPMPGSGSVEICMLSIAKQLADFHHITIICRRIAKQRHLSHINNVTIVRVIAGNQTTYLRSVLQYMKGKHYDLIQVDNRPRFIAKIKQAFPRTPLSLFLHSLTFVPQTVEVAIGIKRADVIIANSSSLKRSLSQRFWSVRHKIRSVHLGVDTIRFKPLNTSEKNEMKRKHLIGSSYVILFVGRVIPRKGIPVLIKATSIVRSKVKHVKLIIVGEGNPSYVRQLKKQAESLMVPIVFKGKVPHQNIHRMFQMADCFVCPSQQHESFGLVNVEAMASGVPVIASRIGGIKEIISDGQNGYLVKHYRDPKRFAHYMTKVNMEKKRYNHLSRSARQTAIHHFTWRHTAKKLNEIYKGMVLRHD